MLESWTNVNKVSFHKVFGWKVVVQPCFYSREVAGCGEVSFYSDGACGHGKLDVISITAETETMVMADVTDVASSLYAHKTNPLTGVFFVVHQPAGTCQCLRSFVNTVCMSKLKLHIFCHSYIGYFHVVITIQFLSTKSNLHILITRQIWMHVSGGVSFARYLTLKHQHQANIIVTTSAGQGLLVQETGEPK